MIAAVAMMTLALNAVASPSRAEPLVPVAIGITLTNPNRTPVFLDFPTPDLFWLQIRDSAGKAIFDSRTGHKPIEVHHRFPVAVGTTRIAIFEWNGLTDERSAPKVPGQYVVHVEVESTTTHLVADVPLELEAPQPITGALRAKPNDQLTIEGIAERDGGRTYMVDKSGKIRVSSPMGLRPQGAFVVRGTMGTMPGDDQPALLVTRYAPAAGNLEPEGTPTPPPLPSPGPTATRRS